LPDSRTHRGPGPDDLSLFGPGAVDGLRSAVADLSWLRGRGYPETAALKLVGDRHALVERQRAAIRRCACSVTALAARRSRQVSAREIRGRPLWIDGFNAILTVEAALGGAVVLIGRDGCARDLAGIHGTYRRVEETRPALDRIGTFLADLGVGPCSWLLDAPVSNSGRLRSIVSELVRSRGWDWRVDVVPDPDPILIASTEVVASADSAILDGAGGWFNLAREVIDASIAGAFVVDLGAVDPK
jgi:hypothetical protein